MTMNFKCSASIAAIAVASALALPAQAQNQATSWQGFYAGVHVGVGDQYADGRFKSGDSLVDFGDLDLFGELGGFQAGYNFEMGSMVAGVEIDLSAFAQQDTVQAPGSSENGSADLDLLASLRGRLGVTVDSSRDILLYGTGGISYRRAEVDVLDDTRGASGVSIDKIDFNDFGGVLGVGVEWAATDMVRVRLEGLYYAFDLFNGKSSVDLGEANTGDFVELEDVWAVRIGVNWHF